jgi:hypothetical protein
MIKQIEKITNEFDSKNATDDERYIASILCIIAAIYYSGNTEYLERLSNYSIELGTKAVFGE